MRRNLRFIKNTEPIYKLNGEPLTKEDMEFLYKQGEKLSVTTIALLFDCEPIIVYIHMVNWHISHRVEDNGFYAILNEMNEEHRKQHYEKADQEWRETQKQEQSKLRQKAIEIYGKPRPEPTITVINGKRFVDDDLVRFYDRKIKEIMKELNYGGVKQAKELNLVRNVDLSAMRLHRGLDMIKFSKVSGIPYKTIMYYEKTRWVIVPKEISDQYIKVLKITAREFKKIKECLSGERKTMFEEDRRDLPDGVREYVFKRDNGKCTKCGATEHLHFHHIERFSKGGKHEAKNLKLLCVKCHALEHYGEKGFAMLKAQAERLLGGEIQWAN